MPQSRSSVLFVPQMRRPAPEVSLENMRVSASRRVPVAAAPALTLLCPPTRGPSLPSRPSQILKYTPLLRVPEGELRFARRGAQVLGDPEAFMADFAAEQAAEAERVEAAGGREGAALKMPRLLASAGGMAPAIDYGIRYGSGPAPAPQAARARATARTTTSASAPTSAAARSTASCRPSPTR
jgi:hypothetical protein